MHPRKSNPLKVRTKSVKLAGLRPPLCTRLIIRPRSGHFSVHVHSASCASNVALYGIKVLCSALKRRGGFSLFAISHYLKRILVSPTFSTHYTKLLCGHNVSQGTLLYTESTHFLVHYLRKMMCLDGVSGTSYTSSTYKNDCQEAANPRNP